MQNNLANAISSRRLDEVRQYLDQGVSPNSVNSKGVSMMYLATSSGEPAIVRMLLERGGNPNDVSGGFTPLYGGAQYPEIVSLLLDAGADPTVKSRGDRTNRTPYIKAILKNTVESAKILAEKGVAKGFDKNAIVNAKDSREKNAAFYVQSADGVRRVVEDGVDLKARDMENNTPLHTLLNDRSSKLEATLSLIEPTAAVTPSFSEVYKESILNVCLEHADDFLSVITALLDKGINIDQQDRLGDTALIIALQLGKVNIARYLLERGANTELANSNRETALTAAAKGTVDPRIVQEILDRGANIDHETITRQTPLMFAIKNRRLEIVQYLLERGANIEHIDADGDTPLIVAAKSSSTIPIIQALLDRGANINRQDRFGYTALMSAIKSLRHDIAEYLAERGADANLVNAFGQTALIIATDHMIEYHEIVEALVDAGANINYQDQNGNTALMHAVRENHADIAQYLMEKGANTQLANARGQTAVTLAKNDDMREILQIIPPQVSPDARIWRGWNQADAGLYDSFYADPINYSSCPVCLAYVQRSQACRYMSHSCKRQSNVVVHPKLFDLYNIAGKIEWCTVCGRVCKNHHHYKLVSHEETVRAEPSEYKPNALFYYGGEAECLQDGGGGIDEKARRLNALRSKALELQSQVGTITEKDARLRLVEASWDGPLQIIGPLRDQRMDIPLTDFPERTAPAVESPATDIPKPADEVANVPEVVEAGGFDSFEIEDVVPAIRFVHKKTDGTVYRHTDDQLIGKQGLTNYIRGMNATESDMENFGFCFSTPECDARLWPQDIQPYILDPAVYETYRQKFNQKFRTMEGGAQPSVFVKMTNAECALPEKKKAGRKTYRRKGRIMRKKTTRNNK